MQAGSESNQQLLRQRNNEPPTHPATNYSRSRSRPRPPFLISGLPATLSHPPLSSSSRLLPVPVLATRGATPHPASQDKKISVACSFASLRFESEVRLLFFLLDFPSARITGLGIRMYMWTACSSLGGGLYARRMLPSSNLCRVKEFVRTLNERFDSCLQVFCILIATRGLISDLIES